MALIKCSECGHEVSDKASTCPNCGCPIEKGLVCNECGALISGNDNTCPNCGNPLKARNGKSKSVLITIFISIVVLIGTLGGFAIVKYLATSNNYVAEKNDEAESTVNLYSEANETQRVMEEDAKEREHKAIVGTYIFNPRKDNYASVDMYNGQKWWKERKLVGYIEWTEYLVVMADYRVSLLRPSERNFVGTVSEIDNGAFIISINSRENASVGAWTTLYKNGRDIGRLGDKGYGYPKNVVIDTKTKRIYNGVQDYKNKDISDVEYIMYDRFSSVIEETNNTEIKRNYLSKEYEREYGM